jgi:hypothetical protein
MRINTLQQGNLMTMKQLGHATKEIIEHGLLASSNNIMEARTTPYKPEVISSNFSLPRPIGPISYSKKESRF